MCNCIDCGKEIVSGKVCKFCKCFKRPVIQTTMEVSMDSVLLAKRLQFQEIVVKEAGYSYEEAAEMSLVELRNVVDEVRPLMIVNKGLTATGGKTRKVTVIRKQA